MSTVCSGCGNSIMDLFYMECQQCSKLFDLLCLNINKESFIKFEEEYKASWICPKCHSARPKGDNLSTPLSPAPGGALNDTYTKTDIYVNKKRGTQHGPVKPSEESQPLTRGSPIVVEEDKLKKGDVYILLEEIRSLRQEILEIKENNYSLKEQITSYQQLFNNSMSDHSKKLEAAEREIMDLRTTVDNLCLTINQREQESLRNELEIMGITETNNENVGHLALLAVKKLGVAIAEEDIDDIRRVGPRLQKSSPETNKMPRPIVVKLLRRRKRDEIISAARTRRNITAEDIVGGAPGKIYFNERLTKLNRQLFRAARERARKGGYRYCWVQNGTIFVRRSDGKPAIRISCQQDLDLKIARDEPQKDDGPADVSFKL